MNCLVDEFPAAYHKKVSAPFIKSKIRSIQINEITRNAMTLCIQKQILLEDYIEVQVSFNQNQNSYTNLEIKIALSADPIFCRHQ